MSRLKERKERKCLNCHIAVKGRFCHRCGQENIEPKESVWDLISHFFKDITHFDGKFFSTIKYLFKKPGFLSKEYMIGRRASYVNPIRLYVFTSAFFFLIFFSLNKVDRNLEKSELKMNGKTYTEIEAMDSLAFDAFTRNINKEDDKPGLPMTREVFKQYFDSMALKNTFRFTSKVKYKSKAEYDSILASGKMKHNWLKKQFTYREIEINKKYHDREGEFNEDFTNMIQHSLPQVFFVLLPLFALILKLLYIRRKQFYYVNHAIFSIHFYILWFMIMLIIIGLTELNSMLDWTFINYLQLIMGLGIFFYLYKAMRNFYQQRRAKTALKFLILSFLLLVSILFIFSIFVFYSLFKI
jgi:hypothetical protein